MAKRRQRVGLNRRGPDVAAATASFEDGYDQALAYMRDRVQARLRESATVLVAAGGPPVAVDPQRSYDDSWWSAALALFLAGRYESLLDEAEGSIADELGVDVDDPAVADAAEESVDELIAQAQAQAGGQRQWVVDKVAAALASGADLDDTLGAVAGDTGPLAPDRAPLLAGLAVAATWNVAALAVARAAGGTAKEAGTPGVLYKTWNCVLDDQLRDEHEALEGVTIPVADDFEMDGYLCARPGDERLPPELSINCRCHLSLSREAGDEPEEATLDMEALTASGEDDVLFVESSGLVADDDIELHTHGRCPGCGAWLSDEKYCHRCERGYEGAVVQNGRPAAVEATSDTINGTSDAGEVAPSGVPMEDTRMEPTATASSGNATNVTLTVAPAGSNTVNGWTTSTVTTATKPKVQLAEMGQVAWRGVIAIEGKPTGDGRLFRRGALYWGDLPVDLFVMLRDPEGGTGHDGSEIGGRVDRIWKQDTADYAEVWGEGIFDTNTAAGAEAARLQSNGMLTGVSIDVDSVEYEMPEDIDIKEYTAGRIRRITVCSIPAFIEARIFPVNDDQAETVVASGAELVSKARMWTPWKEATLVASAVVEDRFRSPLVDGDPPAEVFKRQTYSEYTPMTVDAEGRVQGHVAGFQSCHIGFTDRCVTAPKSSNGYRHACTAHTLTADGQLVATARIFGQFIPGRRGHAPLSLGSDEAVGWYENMTAALADVAVYEDDHGIQVQGRVRPGVTRDQVAALRGSDVSPDWRSIRGRLECVGFAAVNTSGFPNAYRELPALVASGAAQRLPADGEVLAGVAVKGGEVVSLVASPIRLGDEGRQSVQLAERVRTLEERLAALEAKALAEEAAAYLEGLPSEADEQARLAALAAEVLDGVDLGEPVEAQEDTSSTVADTQSDGPEPPFEVVRLSGEQRKMLAALATVLHPFAAGDDAEGDTKTCPNCGAENPADATECEACGWKLGGGEAAAQGTVEASACSCGGSCGECVAT